MKKQLIIIYAITAAGDVIKYDPRMLARPKSTKLYKRLETALNSRQLTQIGYGPVEFINKYIK